MPNPKRGEIWWVNMEPVVGSEIGKARPAVVMQDDLLGRLPVRVVVPITGWGAGHEEHVWLTEITPNAQNGLSKRSAADALQIRTVSVLRFGDRLGTLPAALVDEIAGSIAVCVKVPQEGGKT